MKHRVICSAIASLALVAGAVGPAFATDDFPSTGLQDAPSVPQIRSVLDSSGRTCKDGKAPKAGFGPKSARAALRSHVLRGTAHDGGTRAEHRCGVAHVSVSVFRKRGKQCQYLTTKRRLSKPTKCRAGHWLAATGTNRWRLTMPKRLPRGTYMVQTRAIDHAGNVQSLGKGGRRLRLG